MLPEAARPRIEGPTNKKVNDDKPHVCFLEQINLSEVAQRMNESLERVSFV
jgi:hypothetical protein